MTPLRQKLIDAIDVRGLSPLTRRNYTEAVAKLARHYKKSPDALTDDQIRDYLLHLIRDLKRAPATVTVAVCALRFFYRAVLNRSLYAIETALPHMRKPVKRPQVYSTGEIEQLLRAQGLNGKHRMLLMTAYATGLRVAELCRLRVEDINSARMQVRVIQGKGGKDRYTTLSAKLLDELRSYWKVFRPRDWLFPSRQRPDKPVTSRTAERVFLRALELTGLPRRGGIHSLRHSFATHLLEMGVELPVLQRLLGHRSLNATAVYLHVSQAKMATVSSPLDLVDVSLIRKPD